MNYKYNKRIILNTFTRTITLDDPEEINIDQEHGNIQIVTKDAKYLTSINNVLIISTKGDKNEQIQK